MSANGSTKVIQKNSKKGTGWLSRHHEYSQFPLGQAVDDISRSVLPNCVSETTKGKYKYWTRCCATASFLSM
jgi:hypothetical protein